MDTQTPQPTILVKKADGSYVRVPKHEALGKKQPPVTPSAPSAPTPLPPETPVQPEARVQTSATVPAPASTPRRYVPPAPVAPPKKHDWDTEDHTSLLDPEFHAAAPVTAEVRDMPKVAPPASVASTKNVPALDRVIRAAAANEGIGIRGIGGTKPFVRDIEKPQPMTRVSMGPVDELRAFTLTDWRRLGTTASAAGEQVWKKFSELQQESYILFLDGVRAWHDSPLYRDYLDRLTESLTRGVPIDEFLGKGAPDALKPEEWMAILALNNRLT